MAAVKGRFTLLLMVFLFLNAILNAMALADKTHPCSDEITDMRRTAQDYAQRAQEYKSLNPGVEDDDTDYMSISVPANCYNACADQMENPDPAFANKTYYCQLKRTVTYPDGRQETTTKELFTLKCDCPQDKQQEQAMPAEQQEMPQEVEALVEKTPTENDLQLPANGQFTKIIRMAELDGLADFQLPDGTWIPIEEGDTLPPAGTLHTAYGSTATLHFSDHIIINAGPLSEFNIREFDQSPKAYRAKLNLGAGEVRFKVLEGDFDTDMEVQAPQIIAGVTGTDFSVAYNKDEQKSIAEVYDDSVQVTNIATGESKTISSSYGSPIRRIEVYKGGAMAEYTAIPKNEWQMRQQKEQSSGYGIYLIPVLVIAAVGAFFFYMKQKKSK